MMRNLKKKTNTCTILWELTEKYNSRAHAYVKMRIEPTDSFDVMTENPVGGFGTEQIEAWLISKR